MYSDSDEISVRISNVSKVYKLYPRPVDRLVETLFGGKTPRHKPFRALKDINLEIKRGETIGLIGPNGSGKSTLLEILCGTMEPTTGSIETRGRIAALLELGAGFNPEFSGRENVYLNASVMGVPKEVVDERFAEVAAFAEIGDYIDRPVKTYSSGMYVRLAFASAINMEPEILIVDEALSVGDISFQRKCYRHFQEMQRRGVTVIFVTHATELIRAHCHRAVYISAGEVKALGDPRDVVHEYLHSLFTRQESDGDTGNAPELGVTRDGAESRASYNPSEYRWGNRQAEIVDYEIESSGIIDPKVLDQGAAVRLRLLARYHAPLKNIIYGLTIKTVDGITVFGANTRARNMPRIDADSADEAWVEFEFVNHLLPGEYFISLGIAQDDDSVDNLAIDRRYDMIHVTVQGDDSDFGISDVEMRISHSHDAGPEQ